MDLLVMPGSSRVGSLNTAVAELIVRSAANMDRHAAVADLADFPMPLYHGDDETRYGVPDAAVAIHDLIVSAGAVIFVSPEYNGGPTPVLKNTIDWVSRVSKRPLESKPVGLASATPGRGGGQTGLTSMRLIMKNMRADLVDADLSVGNARQRLADDDPELSTQVDAFVVAVLEHQPSTVSSR